MAYGRSLPGWDGIGIWEPEEGLKGKVKDEKDKLTVGSGLSTHVAHTSYRQQAPYRQLVLLRYYYSYFQCSNHKMG